MNAPAENKQLEPYLQAIAGAKEKFEKINSINHLVNYDKEAMFCMQIVQANNYLMKIVNENPQSLRNAVVNVASIGLSLNPAEKLAYIVPRKGQACLDVSYIGLIKLATDTGSIMWARAELIYENDDFIYHGATEKPEFSTPNPFNRGNLQGVYCVAKTKEGDYLSGIMSLKECYDIRDRSEAYKAFKEKGFACSWTTDEGEMIKKTIIKRESKTWPKTDKSHRMDDAIEVINEHEGIDFSRQIDDKPIDWQQVENGYIKAIECVDCADPLEGSNMAIELFKNLTPDEQIAVNNKLKNYKPGKRQYNTLFREVLNYSEIDEPRLPEHLQ